MVGQLPAVVGNGSAPAQLNLTRQRPLIGTAARLIALSPVLGLPYQLVVAHLVTAVVDLAGLPCGNIRRFRICGVARAIDHGRQRQHDVPFALMYPVRDAHTQLMLLAGGDCRRQQTQVGTGLAVRLPARREVPAVAERIPLGIARLGSDGQPLTADAAKLRRYGHHRRLVLNHTLLQRPPVDGEGERLLRWQQALLYQCLATALDGGAAGLAGGGQVDVELVHDAAGRSVIGQPEAL